MSDPFVLATKGRASSPVSGGSQGILSTGGVFQLLGVAAYVFKRTVVKVFKRIAVLNIFTREDPGRIFIKKKP